MAALKTIEQEAFFQSVRLKTLLVLYANPIAYAHFGYEGEAFSKGGYLLRGFNDLQWLPEVPLAASGPVPGKWHGMARFTQRRRQRRGHHRLGRGRRHARARTHASRHQGRAVRSRRAAVAATFSQDPGEAFGQLTWLEPRTPSGTWGAGRASPTMPVWIAARSAARRCTGPPPHRACSGTRSVRAPPTATSRAPRSSIGRSTTRSSSAGTASPKSAWASRDATAFPACRRRTTSRSCTTARASSATSACTPITWRSTRARRRTRTCASSRASARRAARPTPSGARCTRRFRAPRRPASSTCASRCLVTRIEHDAAGRVSAVVYRDATARSSARRHASSASPATPSRRRACCCCRSRRAFRTGSRMAPTRWGATTATTCSASYGALFEQPVHVWRGAMLAGVVEDENVNNPERGFAGGYHSSSPCSTCLRSRWRPCPTAGAATTRRSSTTTATWPACSINGEDLPRADNRITLSTTVKDSYGVPVAHVHCDEHPNDMAMREHAQEQGKIYEAVGASAVVSGTPPATHNMGTARMSNDPARRHQRLGRAHDVPNLFISDGSVQPRGSANPTLTIVALALRQAELHRARARRRATVGALSRSGWRRPAASADPQSLQAVCNIVYIIK